MKWMSRLLLVLILFIIILSGCKASTPKPVSYEFSTQKKMQAIHHWNLLAEDVSNEIAKKVKKNSLNTINEIYVEKDTNSVFSNAFYDLLVSKMLGNGINVSTNKKTPYKLNYTVQVVHHKTPVRHQSWPGTYTATASLLSGSVAVARNISGGVANGLAATAGTVLLGGLTDASIAYNLNIPYNEVLISTTIKKEHEIKMKKTDIYYINDGDFTHYLENRFDCKNYNIKN